MNGFAAVAYQSAFLTFTSRDAQRSLLVRVAGQATKGHKASKTDLAQRAKGGYCPFCTVPTHIAVPPQTSWESPTPSKPLGRNFGRSTVHRRAVGWLRWLIPALTGPCPLDGVRRRKP